MADENKTNNEVYSANDPLDINELAALNDDISPEFIEQLQNQVSMNAIALNGDSQTSVKDSDLFEEPKKTQDKNVEKNNETSKSTFTGIDSNIDDNFIKKYKAKLNKQEASTQEQETVSGTLANATPKEIDVKPIQPKEVKDPKEIEKLSAGNIIEKPLQKEQKSYNDSLDYLDDNIKYSKYVIYIDPENTEFIESLTVKERKNLINRILREQDDVTITKRRLNLLQTVIKHSIVAIITVAIAIPVIYFTVNASLEASINNYRRSEKAFQILYREKGKIKTRRTY